MRPEHLAFTGIRSYRTEQRIDFTGVTLGAITGDTGVGKSSILEAIFFALYGSCTWDHRDSKTLIAHGGDGTARAELTFRAKGKRWQVTRSVSAGTSPPSVNRLECLDDGSRTTGDRAVTAAIKDLLGLDEHTFLKSVVLPQGKFHELLLTPPAERTRALKRLLGLDQLDVIREQAQHRHNLLLPKLERMRAQRDTLPQDPNASLAAANAQRDEAQQHLQTMRGHQTTAQNAIAAGQAALAEADNLDHTAGGISAATGPGIAVELERIAALDGKICAEVSELQRRIGDLRSRVKDITAEIDHAAANGVGPANTNSAIEKLLAIKAIIDAIPTFRHKIDTESSAVAADDTALAALRSGADELAANDAAANAAKVEMVNAAGAAEDLARDCSSALEKAREKARAHHRETTELQDAEAKLVRLRIESEAARDRENEVKAELDTATASVEVERRVHSAAHAAEASHAGDPCPVCRRELPEEFNPPVGGNLDELTRRVRSLDRRWKKLSVEAADAAGNLKAAEAVRNRLAAEVAKAADEQTRAEAALVTLLGPCDFGQDDAQLLAATLVAAQRAQAASTQAAAEALKVHGEATAAQAQVRAAAGALQRRRAALEALVADRQLQTAMCRETAGKLPDAYRISELTPEAVESAASKARQVQAQHERRAGEREKLRTTIDELAGQERLLQQRVDNEVRIPETALLRQAQTLADLCAKAQDLLADHTVTLGEPEATVTDRARWARTLADTAAGLINACTLRGQELRQMASGHDAEARIAREAAGADSDEQLNGLVVAAAVAVEVAAQDISRAQAQIPAAERLDVAIAGGTPFVRSLGDLASLLTDSRFIGTVVTRRQQDLLTTAATLLKDMTQRRFAFTADFRIFDRHTGEVRDSKTLSGGETFLASLALALAVVELAGSSGGRAEALFLDEGFGTLDSDTLDDALDALALQAQAGRLVVVISHMQAVAEHVPHVMTVTSTTAGSSARWLDPAERQAMVADQVDLGLLS